MIEALRDITDLIEAQQSRTESEELLRQVIDATSVGIFVKDREGNYVVANELVAKIHGRRLTSPSGPTSGTIRCLTPRR